ncbi:MAG: hypothetical protein IJA27_02955 [Lachnospiraceae bacterium]|nr:hypothetical protein [Lachnospiraceae bacterium]
MFGSIICNKNDLTEEELKRYQSAYCGLCRSLKLRYGQVERFSLNYDMTFLALLLDALYECEEKIQEVRCPVHPMKKKPVIGTKYIDYAADMTILLAYFKCKDDWEDEHKKSSRMYGKLIRKDYENIIKKYPRQSKSVEDSLKRLSIIEKSADSIPDEAINCSGMMLSEIFVYEEDFWSDALRRFGYELGRFIYLMDATLDYEEDKKKLNYNPLFEMEKKPEEMEPILSQVIGNAAFQFEKLPIIQDVNIMRNILYGGVWQQYHAKVTGKEEKHGK